MANPGRGNFCMNPNGLDPAIRRQLPLLGECGLCGTDQCCCGESKPASQYFEARTL